MTATVSDVRAWLQHRIDTIKADGHGPDLSRAWPEGVPTLKQADTHTDDQLEQIRETLNRVEAAHQMPFGDVDPRKAQEPPPPLPPKHVPLPAEGPDVDDAEIAGLEARYRNLPDAGREMVDTVGRFCIDAGVPIALGSHPTLRRFLITAAVLDWADRPMADFFDAVATVTGCTDGDDAGMVIGTLTVRDAATLARAAK